MQIGQILREARENKGISLDDLQAETKIQKRYLIAIEQNAFHSLPGTFYARAFIREYALAVDLNPEELLAEFDASHETTDEVASHYQRMDRTNRTKATKSSFWSIFPTIIVVLLIIGILFVGWLLFQNMGDDAEDSQNQSNENEIVRDDAPKNNENNNNNANAENEENDTNETDENEENESEENENEFSVVQAGEGSTPFSEVDFSTSEDKVEISFDSSAACYVMITDENNKVYFEGIIEPDDVPDNITVEDVERLNFNVGNAEGLKFLFNEKEMEYPVDSSTVVQQLQINMTYNKK